METAVLKYIKEETPLGPIDTSNVTDDEALARLFSRDNLLFKQNKRNPSAIIGRRGSGKTTYLKMTKSSGLYHLIVSVETNDCFNAVIGAVEKQAAQFAFPEDSAKIWEKVFYLALFNEMLTSEKWESSELRYCRDYLARLGLGTSRSCDEIMWRIVHTLRTEGEGLTKTAAAMLTVIDDVDFTAAKTECLTILDNSGTKAVILVDNLDGYKLDNDKVTHAITGLLKAIGKFNATATPCDIRFCMPAEVYHDFLRLSSNPTKDFQSQLILHWHPKELLLIISHRLLLCLQVLAPELYDIWRNKIDPESVADAKVLIGSFFPPVIYNSLNIPESPLSYIMRHTQLLPRQALLYFNQIFNIAIRQNLLQTQIGEDILIRQIAHTEHIIAAEVVSGFSHRYPYANAVFERCIPELGFTFKRGDLHRILNSHGRGIVGDQDIYQFERLFIETGCVGRVASRTDRYVKGKFEYTSPYKLIVASDEELCLHPVFAAVYHARKPSKPFAILPFGADPDDPEYREF